MLIVRPERSSPLTALQRAPELSGQSGAGAPVGAIGNWTADGCWRLKVSPEYGYELPVGLVYVSKRCVVVRAVPVPPAAG